MYGWQSLAMPNYSWDAMNRWDGYYNRLNPSYFSKFPNISNYSLYDSDYYLPRRLRRDYLYDNNYYNKRYRNRYYEDDLLYARREHRFSSPDYSNYSNYYKNYDFYYNPYNFYRKNSFDYFNGNPTPFGYYFEGRRNLGEGYGPYAPYHRYASRKYEGRDEEELLVILAEIANSYGILDQIRDVYTRQPDFDPSEIRRMVDSRDELDHDDIDKIFRNFDLTLNKSEIELIFKIFGDKNHKIDSKDLLKLILGKEFKDSKGVSNEVRKCLNYILENSWTYS